MHLSAAPERCFVLEAKLGLVDVCMKTCKQAGKPEQFYRRADCLVPARQTWDCQVKPGAWQEAKKHKDILSGSQIRLGQSYSRLPCRLCYGARCLARNKSLSSERNNRQPGRRPVPDRLGRPLGFHSSRLIRRFLSCCSSCSLLFCSKRLCSCQFNYTEH